MTRKVLLIACILATLLVSGCTLPGTPPCHHLSAVWEEAGIFEAFPAPGTVTGWIVQHPPLPDGLPFQDDALDTAWGDDYVLTQVSMRHDHGRFPWISLWPGGQIEAVFEDGTEPTLIRDIFHRFAREIVDANETQMGDWASIFVRSATLQGEPDRTTRMMHHTVTINEPDLLGTHYDDLGLAPENGTFTPELSADGWRYHFALPEKQAARDIGDGGLYRVVVNTLDTTMGAVVSDTDDPEAARLAMIEGLAALGIEADGPDPGHPFHTLPC